MSTLAKRRGNSTAGVISVMAKSDVGAKGYWHPGIEIAGSQK